MPGQKIVPHQSRGCNCPVMNNLVAQVGSSACCLVQFTKVRSWFQGLPCRHYHGLQQNLPFSVITATRTPVWAMEWLIWSNNTWTVGSGSGLKMSSWGCRASKVNSTLGKQWSNKSLNLRGYPHQHQDHFYSETLGQVPQCRMPSMPRFDGTPFSSMEAAKLI